MLSEDRTTVTWRAEEKAAVVTLAGSFDFDISHDAAVVFDEAVRTGLPVIADLSGVEFADSALLNILLRVRRAHRLLIAGPVHAQTMRVFAVTGTQRFLDFHPDLAAARVAAAAHTG